MAEQAAKDEASKKRIVSHMNNDHSDSIIRYLEYYHGLSSWTAYNGTMADIDLNQMTFLAGGKSYKIPFEPPLSSYRETRERVVEMDRECLSALDKSDITVQTFIPPTVSAFYAIEFLVVTTTFLGYSQRWWFGRGEIVAIIVGEGFARFSWLIQPWLISFMLILHASEAVYFARNRLRRHSVNVRTALWWRWVATTFIEGVFSYQRFDDHVQKRRQEKEKQKH